MKYLKIILILVISSLVVINYSKNIVLLEVNNESNLIEIKNPSIVTNDNRSDFKALLINNSNKEIYVDNVEIIIKDSEQNIICNFNIRLNKLIEIGDKIDIKKNVNYDLSDAISFDYVINS